MANKKLTSQEKALFKFMEVVGGIRDELEALTQHIDDHMGCSPEEINFGHVGSAQNILCKLKEIGNFAFRREDEE